MQLPRLPEPIQEIIAPQAFSWQHKDVSSIRIATHRDRPEGSPEDLFRLVAAEIDALRYDPRSMSAIKATLISAVTEEELERKAKDQDPSTAGQWGRLSKHPAFHRVVIPGADGFQQSAILATRDKQSPSVIILPGTFDSCDALYIRDTALFCFRHGYNVLVLEPRNHGASLTAWTSLGWKESTDILAAARWLKESHGSGSSVGVIGFSLGAWYAIRAGYEASIQLEDDLLSGGILAFSPPIDIRAAVQDWDRPEFRGNALTLRSQVFAQFDSYLRTRVDAARKNKEFKAAGGDFDAYIELAARAYGLKNRNELYEKACIPAPELAARMRVPLVVFHAKDDPVVRVRHSLALQAALGTHPNDVIKVVIKNKGGHVALHELDPRYFVRLVVTVLDGLKQEGVSI